MNFKKRVPKDYYQGYQQHPQQKKTELWELNTNSEQDFGHHMAANCSSPSKNSVTTAQWDLPQCPQPTNRVRRNPHTRGTGRPIAKSPHARRAE